MRKRFKPNRLVDEMTEFEAKNWLTMIVENLDSLDEKNYFGAIGWKNYFGLGSYHPHP